jgi:hypothetical protein
MNNSREGSSQSVGITTCELLHNQRDMPPSAFGCRCRVRVSEDSRPTSVENHFLISIAWLCSDSVGNSSILQARRQGIMIIQEDVIPNTIDALPCYMNVHERIPAFPLDAIVCYHFHHHTRTVNSL